MTKREYSLLSLSSDSDTELPKIVIEPKLQCLPRELIVYIFNFLDRKEQMKKRIICKRVYRYITKLYPTCTQKTDYITFCIETKNVKSIYFFFRECRYTETCYPRNMGDILLWGRSLFLDEKIYNSFCQLVKNYTYTPSRARYLTQTGLNYG